MTINNSSKIKIAILTILGIAIAISICVLTISQSTLSVYAWDNSYLVEIDEHHNIEKFSQEYDIISPLWDAGGPNYMQYGNNGTHQVIAGMAFNYVRHHFPMVFDRNLSVIPNQLRRDNMPTTNTTSTARRAFVTYSDWPDWPNSGERGPEMLFGFWSNTSHFYRPSNGLNWFRDYQRPGINARERTGFYFDRAVQAYNQNNPRQAFYYLGAASHFLTDLASPPHTGDQVPSAMASWSPVTGMALVHVHFEEIAQDVVRRLVNSHNGNIPIGTNFSGQAISRLAFPNIHPFYLAREVALISYSEYPNINGIDAYEARFRNTIVANKMLPIAVNANVSMLLRFMEVVGWQENGLRIVNNSVVDFIPPPNFNGTVNIPYGITAIGPNAFAGSTDVMNVTIPSTVGRINVNIKNNDYFS